MNKRKQLTSSDCVCKFSINKITLFVCRNFYRRVNVRITLQIMIIYFAYLVCNDENKQITAHVIVTILAKL